ncbi:MAG: hypothetical protein WCK55_17430 [Verrucomicrobiota bacterium]
MTHISTPPAARPSSDRFRRGGRESKFQQKSLTKPGANASSLSDLENEGHLASRICAKEFI